MKTNVLKRIAALSAAAIMMSIGTGTMPIIGNAERGYPIYADDSEREAVNAVLAEVRKRCVIPERFTGFNYRIYTKLGKEYFDLTWEDKEKNKYLEIDYSDGLIKKYEFLKIYDSDDDEGNSGRPSLANLSDAELIAKARVHLKKMNPSITDRVRYRLSGIRLFSGNAYINIDRYEDGILVDGNGGEMVLDKKTGELVRLNIEWFWEGTKFPDKKDMISLDELRESYKNNTTLTPIYYVSREYNYETQSYGKKKAELHFISDFNEEIDAITGEKASIWKDMDKCGGQSVYNYEYFNNIAGQSGIFEGSDSDVDDGDDEDYDNAGSVRFTEAELRAIKADETMLKQSDIAALLRNNKYINMPSYTTLMSSELYIDENTGEYIYDVTYSGGSYNYSSKHPVDANGNKLYPIYDLDAKINAKTGKIIEFDINYGRKYKDDDPYPYEKNEKIAKEAAKFFYGDILDKFTYIPTKNEVGGSEIRHGYVYNRYVNGVIVDVDNILIVVDEQGNIIKMKSVYSDIKFPEAHALDKDKAFEVLLKNIDVSLYYDGYYRQDGTVKTYLLYDIPYYSSLDADYRPINAYPRIKTIPKYTDIKGIPQEKAIKTLADHGVTLPCSGRKFDPDGKLTNKVFAVAVYHTKRNYVPSSVSSGEFLGKKAEKYLTKKEAAKIFVECCGGDAYAEIEGIFRAPFKDVPSSHEYSGYIAIANALGFVIADKDGNFNPDRQLTRAEAMQMIYDYVSTLG